MGDPATMAAIIGGLNFAGGLAAPEGTEVGPIGLIPLPDGSKVGVEDILGSGVGGLIDLQRMMADRAQTPVNLRSAFAQQPPSFAGGGLPMPIGVTGIDPALANRSLLQGIPPVPSPGFQDPFSSPPDPTGATRRTSGGAGGGGGAIPRPPGQAPGTSALTRPTIGGGGRDLLASPDSAGGPVTETQRAMNALDLLLMSRAPGG